MGLAIGLRGSSELLVDVLVVGAVVSGAGTVMSLLPICYALGSGAAGGESNGLAAWRILTRGTRRIPVTTHGVETPGHRPSGPLTPSSCWPSPP